MVSPPLVPNRRSAPPVPLMVFEHAPPLPLVLPPRRTVSQLVVVSAGSTNATSVPTPQSIVSPTPLAALTVSLPLLPFRLSGLLSPSVMTSPSPRPNTASCPSPGTSPSTPEPPSRQSDPFLPKRLSLPPSP